MQEVIKIHEVNQKQVFSAKELYDFLGLDKSNWKRWYEKNITQNPFAIETLDFWGFVIKTSGNETKDFWITIDFAKRLSMLVRNEKGEEIRRYFVRCEEKLSEVKQSIDDLEYLRFDQVLYIIDLITCFKFITHQKAATDFYKDTFIQDIKNKNGNITTESAAKYFHKYRNEILDIEPEEVEKRFQRYISNHSIFIKNQKTKHDKLYMMNQYDVIGHAVFDFLRASNKVEEISLKISNFAKSMSKRMNIEVRDENIADLFNDKVEILNNGIMKAIEPFIKEPIRQLK